MTFENVTVSELFNRLAVNGYLGDPIGELAFCYIRVSSAQQAEEGRTGLPRQLQHCHEIAKERHLKISWDLVFADDGFSGFEFENRPALTQLRNEIKSQSRSRYLVIEHIDRLSRNARWHQGFLLDEFARYHVTPVFWKAFGSEIERAYFEQAMAQAMGEGRRVLCPDGIGVVVFAHKSTSGWEAQLQAMVDAGWIVTGSWPIDTERPGRLRAQDSAALASSVHLVCRPRENADGAVRADNVGDWRDVLAELPKRIHDWMPRLAAEGVVGADAIFACLGPALQIFSQYSRVETSGGVTIPLGDVMENREVRQRGYLSYVWEAVAKEALKMIFEGADATGFEEDARLTAMWLWTLGTKLEGTVQQEDSGEDSEEAGGDDESAKAGKLSGYLLEYDTARKIGQGLGAHLERLTSLVEIKGDKARLLPVSERARHLFGKDEGKAPSAPSAKRKQVKQLDMFETVEQVEEEDGGWGEKNAPQPGETVLDRIHQSMILFAAGRSDALKRFLVENGAGNDQRFWRLAQALSALYPASSDEKRWVDGVLARKKGLGF